MKPLSIMLIAGEASGDVHAAGLAEALRQRLGPRAPRFFGAGGRRMAAAGVDIHLDLTAHAVFGLAEVFRELAKFRGFLRQLIDLALQRQPDLIVLVDSAGFNRRFAAAIRRRVARRHQPFAHWSPRIVYYISPQVWASRAGRARQLARDVDLLLSIFPFERDWYAQRVPQFRVEFVGHPAAERYAGCQRVTPQDGIWRVLLLPGSRVQELRRHLPVMIESVRRLSREHPVIACTTFPDVRLLEQAGRLAPLRPVTEWPETTVTPADDQPIGACVGRLPELLSRADLALAKSGSVTLECACFRIPAVVIYRVAWPTWAIARRLVRVPYVAMPNLLAGKQIYPEFLQAAATPDAIAGAARELLQDAIRRREIESDLERVIESLGGSGAYRRAAEAVAGLLEESASTPPPTVSQP